MLENKPYPFILKAPKFTVIEKVAGEMAAVYYEAGRNTGMTSKHKDARSFARANLERFIPVAVHILTGMLGRKDLPTLMKDEIYDALMERVNDPMMQSLIKENTPSPMSPPEHVKVSKGDIDDGEIQMSMLPIEKQIDWGKNGNPLQNYVKGKAN